MEFIKKLFIKNYRDIESPAVHFRYGIVAGILGIISNIILFIAKIVVGVISGSITIIASAVDNLSDAGSSVVTIFGFKMSGRPADKEHPYGHARYEYVTALIVAILVLVVGVLLGKASLEKIISPGDKTKVQIASYVVLGLAVLIKIWQMALYRNFAKAINSDALRASSVDSRNDVLTTAAVLISTIIIDITGVDIDGYVGIALSIFIVISAIKLIRETINPLIGTIPDSSLVDKIKTKILSYEGVLGLHDLMIHSYGANVCFVIVHVEVSATENMLKSHDMIDNIERDFMQDMGIHLAVHMDPIETDNEQVNQLKTQVEAVLSGLAEPLPLHDFRVVNGNTHINVLFDIVIPFDSQMTLSIVQSALNERFKNSANKYYFVINVDRQFV